MTDAKPGDCFLVSNGSDPLFYVEAYEHDWRSADGTKFIKREKRLRALDSKVSYDLDAFPETYYMGNYLPFDAKNKLIEVGDNLMYPVKSGGAGNGPCIRFGTVVKIEEPTHRGYGYQTRKLKIRDSETNKVFTHPYPANCIKVNP